VAIPFRVEIGALTRGPRIVLTILTAAVFVCGVAAVAAAAAGHYRRTGPFAAGLLLCLGLGWLPLRPVIEPAYPTSYYAPTQPYAAASIVGGAALYAENCALCHGATGRGNGSAAAR
jgi:mono/diheme cytochrome c family protein